MEIIPFPPSPSFELATLTSLSESVASASGVEELHDKADSHAASSIHAGLRGTTAPMAIEEEQMDQQKTGQKMSTASQ